MADAIAALDGLGIGQTNVVGLSMGGFTALHLCNLGQRLGGAELRVYAAGVSQRGRTVHGYLRPHAVKDLRYIQGGRVSYVL